MHNIILQENKRNIYQNKANLTIFEGKPKMAKIIIAEKIAISMNEEIANLTNLMIESIMEGFTNDAKK